MERSRGGNTAGVLVWTPAPAYSFTLSPDESDFSWGEDPDEDFQSCMDENGIIGLAECQRQLEVDLGADEEIAEDLLWDVKTPEPEDGPPSVLEEISYHLSELLDSEPLSQPTGDDSFLQKEQGADDDQSVGLEDWTDEEDDTGNLTIHKQELNTFPERDRALDMTDEETEEKNICEDAQRHMDHSFSNCNNIPTLEITEHSEQSDCEELKKNKGSFLPASYLSCKNTVNSSFFPHLSSEKLMNSCGIEAETFPELALPDWRAESSLSSHQSPAPKIYHTVRSNGEEFKPMVTPQTSARSPVLHSPSHNCQPPVPSPRKTNPGSRVDCEVSILAPLKASSSPSDFSPTHHSFSAPKRQRASKTSHTDPEDIRKVQLSHPLPDFSKVEPRVRFPKGGYKPPKSRSAVHGKTLHPDLPVVLKSPAEIVREVLLSSTDVSPGSPSSSRSHKLPKSTLPEEFRCPQQASTLVQQLQEDYNRLLTKYAEAENTIDRLRLEAKVDLYSDPPKVSTAIMSGVIQEGSKVMTLSFPQAQRAEFDKGSTQLTQHNSVSFIVEISRTPSSRPSSVDSVSSKRPGSITADHLIETLTRQTHRFQIQVDGFGELLKTGKLKPCEQIKGLSTLAEGQESLERTYLDARAQYQMLKKCQDGPVSFDPDRELEGQIFRSGMQLEELKEWMEQFVQNRSTSEPPLTPPPHTDVLSVCMQEAELLIESPLSVVHHQACVEVSSVSGESNREDEEEMVKSHLPLGLHDKHQCVEKDFRNLVESCQSFKELPCLLDKNVTLTSHDSLDYGDSPPPRNEIADYRKRHREPAADCVPPSGPSVRPQVCNFLGTRPEALCRHSLLHPDRERKTAGNRRARSSSLTSLAESAEPGNKGLKAKAKIVRAPPLDGVMSLETDSGFMGSESSQLTSAAHSSPQKRTVVSSIKLSAAHKSTVRSESTPPSGQSLWISPSCLHPSLDPPVQPLRASGGRTDCQEERKGGKVFGFHNCNLCIPLHWPDCTQQPCASSLTSQSEHSSDQVHSLSREEKALNNHYPNPANQQLCSHRIPSLHVPYRHDDHHKAHSFDQLTNQQEALQSLQQEVNKLKERLEGSMSLSKPASPVRAPSSATEDINGHPHPQTSTPQRHNLRHSERSVIGRQSERGRNGEKKEKENSPIPAVRQRSASLPQYRTKPDRTTDSEHVESEPRTSTLRHIPVSPIKTPRGRRRTRVGFGYPMVDCTKQKASSSTGRSEESDETESSRGPEPACPHCLSERTVRSRSSPHLNQSYCSHCPLCGVLLPSQTRASQPANQDPVSIPTRSQPMRSQQRDRVGMNMAVAPPPTVLGGVPVVPYMPVYPSTLYVSSPLATQAYSQPFNILMSPSRDERSWFRSHRRHTLSMDHKPHSLNSSLNRAITAARNMRQVSHHMALSLASGLQNESFLTTSCTY
ncbi:LOW QUALITY PROTEIN: microtubule organization protein AKNA-like [Xyrauchen texanus]|uniref:LOW QUALITY PROTEIN: microtubule organization protein AKNA-like n=1 Tax=Xyrauchen texanus TaxID=154827 RepID=UPI0022429E3F|nr:LOW QUALITY PROTEIN: microtubule organization protein AKNA-like [Xyrauchen texanus]